MLLVDDRQYRETALDDCFTDSNRTRHLSLVDVVIRKMLSSKKIQTDALATFNVRVFYDVSKKHGKEMLPKQAR
jgi:hypothetical protein